MTERVLAAVRTAPGVTELQELAVPDVPDDGALLRVEVAGICGTDVKMYTRPPFADPVIMGHENVGVLDRAGAAFLERHGLAEGDRIFVEHYVGCFRCRWCHAGEYRHCEATDWRTNPGARRYGYTPMSNPGTLWGGFAQYLYLPWNAVIHRIPEGVSAELASVVTPLSNGIEWALNAGGVGVGSTVLIQGPGQQGLSQVVAAVQAGASLVIVSGTSRDASRLSLALDLGAHATIDVQAEDALARVMDITGGVGVDVVLDCTAGAGTAPILLGIDALVRREGVMVTQGEVAQFPDFPLKKLAEKAATIRSARGHSYAAVELALQTLAAHRFPLGRLGTHAFGLADVDLAIRTMAGQTGQDAIHVSLLPWGSTAGDGSHHLVAAGSPEPGRGVRA